jgi:hypothetical protein
MSEGAEFMEVICEKGVLTFDGRVVEVFGFGRQDFSVRVHVARLEKIEVHEGGRFSNPFVNFKQRGMKIDGFAELTEEEAGGPELAALINAVQDATPNPEGG